MEKVERRTKGGRERGGKKRWWWWLEDGEENERSLFGWGSKGFGHVLHLTIEFS